MPYKTNLDIPNIVRNVLPEEAQTIWRKIANNAIAQYGDIGNKAFATAWAGLRNAGWEKSKGKWKKIDKAFEAGDCGSSASIHIAKEFLFDIKKAIDEQRIAFGWTAISKDALGNDVWDLQDDNIEPEELEKLAYRYCQFYRDVGERHDRDYPASQGVMIESVVTTIEKQRIWGVPNNCMPVGWWTGFYIYDDDVWVKIKDGTYSAFSMQGTAQRIYV